MLPIVDETSGGGMLGDMWCCVSHELEEYIGGVYMNNFCFIYVIICVKHEYTISLGC